MPTRKQADRIAELEDRIKVLELRIAALEARQPIVIMPLPPAPIQVVPVQPITPPSWKPPYPPMCGGDLNVSVSNTPPGVARQYASDKPLFRPDATSGVN